MYPRQLILPMLKNQLAQLPSGGRREIQVRIRRPASPGAGTRRRIRPSRPIPTASLADGLPEILEASLRPFRDRLEASYSPMINLFEIYHGE